jgi:hypothetical protein
LAPTGVPPAAADVSGPKYSPETSCTRPDSGCGVALPAVVGASCIERMLLTAAISARPETMLRAASNAGHEKRVFT